MASSSPSQLKIPISRSSHLTRRCSPGGSSSTGQMSMISLKVRLGRSVLSLAAPGYVSGVLDVRTLEEGAQTAESIAEALVGWIAPARTSLDLALYDVRLPGPVGDSVADALRGALGRGVRVRIAFNDDTPGPDPRPFEPPPPSTGPHRLEALGAEPKPIPGWRDLMHHKYVV